MIFLTKEHWNNINEQDTHNVDTSMLYLVRDGSLTPSDNEYNITSLFFSS